MNKAVLIALLCTLSLQQTVLLKSDVTTTIITSPSSFDTAIEAYHTTNNPNYIGYAAQWIYKKGGSSWPAGDRVTF
jgi:hypothetical protein